MLVGRSDFGKLWSVDIYRDEFYNAMACRKTAIKRSERGWYRDRSAENVWSLLQTLLDERGAYSNIANEEIHVHRH